MINGDLNGPVFIQKENDCEVKMTPKTEKAIRFHSHILSQSEICLLF